ncbi:MAG: MFS transporter, partial [Actinomycetota bacterium]|nr:MFS transporter [Actinomycetota bacterium]
MSTPDVKDAQPAMTSPDQGARSRQKPRIGRRGAALVGTPLLVLGVVLAALNLRPAVTSLASVLDEVRGSVGASHAWASALTALPVLCFGLAGVLAPPLARRFGVARAIGFALVMLTTGLGLRVIDGPLVVLGGTLIACSGIAVANVLIPVVIKQSYPHRIGVVTGLYTAALAAGGGMGSAVTPSLHNLFGEWRGALGAWAILAAAAFLLWIVSARRPSVEVSASSSARGRSLFGNRLAWIVTVFFGLQALVAYTVMGWLPEILVDAGVSRSTAGLLLAVTNLLGVPLSLLLPPLA